MANVDLGGLYIASCGRSRDNDPPCIEKVEDCLSWGLSNYRIEEVEGKLLVFKLIPREKAYGFGRVLMKTFSTQAEAVTWVFETDHNKKVFKSKEEGIKWGKWLESKSIVSWGAKLTLKVEGWEVRGAQESNSSNPPSWLCGFFNSKDEGVAWIDNHKKTNFPPHHFFYTYWFVRKVQYHLPIEIGVNDTDKELDEKIKNVLIQHELHDTVKDRSVKAI